MEIPSIVHPEPLQGAKCFLYVPKDPFCYVNLSGNESDLKIITENNSRSCLIQG